MLRLPIAALDVPIAYLQHIITRRRQAVLDAESNLAAGRDFVAVEKLQRQVRQWAELLPWYGHCRRNYLAALANERSRPRVVSSSPNTKMALITSDCGAMRSLGSKWP